MPKPGQREGRASEETARFTDRDDLRQVFHKYVSDPSEPPVLMFYGVGGAGKSALLRTLKAALSSSVPSAFIDFDRSLGGERYLREPALALYAIREQLRIETPRFDLAYATMRRKQGIAGESNASYDIATQVAAALIPTSVGSAAGAAVAKLLKKSLLNKLKDTALERFVSGESCSAFAFELSKLSGQQIETQLLRFIAEDYREHRDNTVRLDRGVSMVLFFDTYESIGFGAQSREHRRLNEQWIQEIVATLDMALVVIAGQNRLAWDEVDPAWADSDNLEQHLLGGLAEKDARHLLSKCDVTDAAIQTVILGSSKESLGGYHCFSLGLFIDTVQADKRAGRQTDPSSLNLTPLDWESLARRFLKSLADGDERNWIEALAVTPRFDEAAARFAFSQERSASQNAAWSVLKDYSFVQKVAGSKAWYTIRSEIATAFRNQPSAADRVLEYHNFWKAYWQERSLVMVDELASLAWYHQALTEPDLAIDKWRSLAWNARTEIPARMREHFSLLQWWAPLKVLAQKTPVNESSSALLLYGDELCHATLGDISLNLHQAIDSFEHALRLCKPEQTSRIAAAYEGCGFAWMRMPTSDLEASLRKAAMHLNEALARIDREKQPARWADVMSNLGMIRLRMPVGDRIEQWRTAKTNFLDALQACDPREEPQLWSSIQNRLGLLCTQMPDGDREENLREGIAAFRAALSIVKEDENPYVWADIQLTSGLAWQTLVKGGREENLRTAIGHLENALRIYTRDEFPEQWASAQLMLAQAYQALPAGEPTVNFTVAKEAYDNALKVYTELAFPQQWAYAQRGLGLLWRDWPSKDAEEKLTNSAAHVIAAMRIYQATPSPHAHPRCAGDLESSSEQEDPQATQTEVTKEPWFLNLLGIDSLFLNLCESLGSILRERQDYADAERWLQQAFAKDPTKASVALQMADVALERRDFRNAADWYGKAFALDGKLTKARVFADFLSDPNGQANGQVLNRAKRNGEEIPLLIAAKEGRTRVAQALVEFGANATEVDRFGRGAIHAAAQSGRLEIVEYLLSLGCSAVMEDQQGWKPIHFAAMSGAVDTCMRLVDSDPSGPNSSAVDGTTPLHNAAASGRVDVCEWLLSVEPRNIDATTLDRRTALHLAALNGRTQICRILCEEGASRSLQSVTGRNALHYSAQTGRADICAFFVSMGSDLSVKTNAGATSYELAQRSGYDEIASTLIV